MKHLVILLISLIFLSGCSVATQIEFTKINEDNIKIKKAVAKLIEENKELKQTVKIQKEEIQKNQEKIDKLDAIVIIFGEHIEKLNNIKIPEEKSITNKQKLQKQEKKYPSLTMKNIEDDFDIKVVSSMANLRDKPTAKSKIIAVANKGEVFKALERSEGEFFWYKVMVGEKELWIYHQNVNKIGNL